MNIVTVDKDALVRAIYANTDANEQEARSIISLALTSPVAPEQVVAASAFQKALDIRIEQGWQLGGNACPVLYTDTINGQQVCRDDLWLATTAGLKGASPEAAPAAPLLMQDENSGRDGRRYNEWHASRPDARLNAREAAEAMAVQGEDWWCDLASRHATADWNCDQPDGYLNAVKALVEDALASTAATPAAPSAVTDLAHELYAMAQGPRPIEDAVEAIATRLCSAAVTPTPASTELRHALMWTAAALQALIASRGESGSINMIVSGEKKSLEDVLDLADASLAQPAPVQAGAQQAVTVTGEMIAAGMKAANVLDPVLATLYPSELTAVYQAMHAVRPFAHATECTTCGALVVGVAEPFDAEEARKRGIDYFADRYPALKEALSAPTQAGAGDALTVIGYTSPGSLRRLIEQEDDSLIVDEESLEGRDVPVYAAISQAGDAKGGA